MLKYDLQHPPLLEALASAGHGSKILIADGNYPFSTARHERSRLIFLNITPGLLDVPQVLAAAGSAVNFEAATVMSPPGGVEVPAHADYKKQLGDDVPFDYVERYAFYDLAMSSDVGIVIATADIRVYANVILTVGLR